MPVPGSSLLTRFVGPYEVRQKLSTTDYVINMPVLNLKTCICHLNLLKYHAHLILPGSDPVSPVVPLLALSAEDIVTLSEYSPEVDGLHFDKNCVPSDQL